MKLKMTVKIVIENDSVCNKMTEFQRILNKIQFNKLKKITTKYCKSAEVQNSV